MPKRLTRLYEYFVWKYIPNNRVFLKKEVERYVEHLSKNYELHEQLIIVRQLIDQIRKNNETDLKELELIIQKSTDSIKTLSQINTDLEKLSN